MSRAGITGGIMLIAAALIAYRVFAPHPPAREAVVALGRGAVSDTSVLTVTGVALRAEALDYNGKTVAAGAGYRYAQLDCRIAAPVAQVRFDDFQLVRDRALTLGQEVNVGDNGDTAYFYWSYLDPAGRAVSTPPATSPFLARLWFKVPSGVPRAFLFYWGLYWGPFELR